MTIKQSLITNPLVKLSSEFGQSVWLDYIRRNMLITGELTALVVEDNLAGLTSNPAIFEKAIAASTDYNDALTEITQSNDLSPLELYEKLAIQDIQQACDILQPRYEKTNKKDGYASLEVSPYLAHDAKATLEEARRLWKLVNRPNLMIKVPATPECINVIETLISEGINVNITLLFSINTYEEVAHTYINGLEKFKAKGGDISKVGSVASFFISRIDSLIDNKLKKIIENDSQSANAQVARSLLGKIAIANAKKAYQLYKNIFGSSQFLELAKRGAKPQRLLWASTSTKDPQYKDVIYVEELIGPETVNTIPPATYAAFKDHGEPRFSLESNLNDANLVLEKLATVGINLNEITLELLVQGVDLFSDAFDKLLEAVAQKRSSVLSSKLNQMEFKMDASLSSAHNSTQEEWRTKGLIRRLWRHDASVWTGDGEGAWLGWLRVVDDEFFNIDEYETLQKEVQGKSFKHALLLGMGGSSLGPEVLAQTFGSAQGFPELLVLDSTDPVQVKHFHDKIDVKNTLFIVSSKSGGTLEPNVLLDYFYDKVKQITPNPGSQFIAITDPDSAMEKIAKDLKFWKIYFGYPSIGGRYSVLSNFGIIPLAVIGNDVKHFLNEAKHMIYSCTSSNSPSLNPGCKLGLALGLAQKIGKDKITIITSKSINDFGAWLEQLIAESTGKLQTGLIPVDLERLTKPELYGSDRVFVYIQNLADDDGENKQFIDQLEENNQVVIRIHLLEKAKLAQEFFRWELAIAIAGAVLKINPFDQPDVEASKVVTKQLTNEYEKTLKYPKYEPMFVEGMFELYTDNSNRAFFTQNIAVNPTLKDYLKLHFNRLAKNDYFSVLAFMERNLINQDKLQEIRHLIRDNHKVATTLGFGPRFLHSTGQLYKGGPNSIVVLQLTVQNTQDLSIPNRKATFGIIKNAQARGDFEVLSERGRRLLNLHINGDLETGLTELVKIMKEIYS